MLKNAGMLREIMLGNPRSLERILFFFQNGFLLSNVSFLSLFYISATSRVLGLNKKRVAWQLSTRKNNSERIDIVIKI